VEVLSEAERFVISLMAAPRAAPRLRAFSMRFVMAEKHAEAAAIFTVGSARRGLPRGALPAAARLACSRRGLRVCSAGRDWHAGAHRISDSELGLQSAPRSQWTPSPGLNPQRANPPPHPHPAPPQDHAKAARELANSRTLRLALTVALAAGNFLNHGSRLGAAAGFRLKSLNKLADSRSGDGKATLLQSVAKEVCARLRKEAAPPAKPPPDAPPAAAGAPAGAAAVGAAASGGGALPTGPADLQLLVDEVPHVVSSRLKSSIADAAELTTQVGLLPRGRGGAGAGGPRG
jgi:hypothetical protein